MSATQQEPATKQTMRRRIARLWPYFAVSRSGWALAIGATIVSAATEPFIPALLKPLLDRGFKTDALDLWVVPLVLILLFTIRGISAFLSQIALAKVTNDGMMRMRSAMFIKLLNVKLDLFNDQNSSTIANTVVYEVFNGSSMLVNAVLRFARDVLTLLALTAYLLYLNWKLTLVVCILFPIVTMVIQVLTKRIYRLTRESQTATDGLAYVVEENVLAHRDVRLHNARQTQGERFESLSQSLVRLSMKSTAAVAGMSAMTQILSAVALSVVVSIAMVQSADNTTTVGGFVAFVTAMLLLIAPIKGLSEVATPVTRGLTALERGLDLIDLNADETGGLFNKIRAEGAVELKEVTFSYKAGNAPSLDCLSLAIKAGETVAFVGASGSGKTTLVNLLPRFLDPGTGAITLDGIDVQEWSLESLRSQFAVVSQHVAMFNDTIAANVALGQAIDRERVKHCLEAANLGEVIASLPAGIDTITGHNAMQLSGGQRQRLAIARALYKNAPILILDEATSALDTESEMAVQEALRRLTENRTSLIIAHRLSTVQHAHRIVVMDSGRIVETGSHAELLARNGIYAHLHQLGFQSA